MDRERIVRFVSEYGISLTHLCLKLCRTGNDAEDLYQETWCRVCDKIDLYDESKPFEPWLFTICVNIYKNFYRKSKRHPVAEFITNEAKDRVFDNIVNSGQSFNEEHDLLRQIINNMDEKYRIVVVLYYLKDYSIAELASVIRIPQGTVKSRLAKAREIIRRGLETHEK